MTMNGNYHFNRFYAQERINARLHEASSQRQARQGRKKNDTGAVIGATVVRASAWASRVADQATYTMKALGEARVAPFRH
jgi:hypothetical protein